MIFTCKFEFESNGKKYTESVEMPIPENYTDDLKSECLSAIFSQCEKFANKAFKITLKEKQK